MMESSYVGIFPPHGGRRSTYDQCQRGKHEIIKMSGFRPLIQMQLCRSGGHLTHKKIDPGDVDGHVHALRLQVIAKDLDVHHPYTWKGWKERKKKDKAGGTPIGNGSILTGYPPIEKELSKTMTTTPLARNGMDTVADTSEVAQTAIVGHSILSPKSAKWSKRHQPWGTVYWADGVSAGSVSSLQTGYDRPNARGKETIPGDLNYVNLATSEGDFRRTIIPGDEWKLRYIQIPKYTAPALDSTCDGKGRFASMVGRGDSIVGRGDSTLRQGVYDATSGG